MGNRRHTRSVAVFDASRSAGLKLRAAYRHSLRDRLVLRIPIVS